MVKFSAGIGWVSTDTGSYDVMKNLIATRVAKRNAYIELFLNAKNKANGNPERSWH